MTMHNISKSHAQANTAPHNIGRARHLPGRAPARGATDTQASSVLWAVPVEGGGACKRQEPQKLSCKKLISIGVNLHTSKGATAQAPIGTSSGGSLGIHKSIN